MIIPQLNTIQPIHIKLDLFPLTIFIMIGPCAFLEECYFLPEVTHRYKVEDMLASLNIPLLIHEEQDCQEYLLLCIMSVLNK